MKWKLGLFLILMILFAIPVTVNAQTPSASLTMSSVTPNSFVMKHMGGDTLDLTDIEIYKGSTKLVPTSGWSDTSFGAGDTTEVVFSSNVLEAGEPNTISLVYVPTGSTIASVTFVVTEAATPTPTATTSTLTLLPSTTTVAYGEYLASIDPTSTPTATTAVPTTSTPTPPPTPTATPTATAAQTVTLKYLSTVELPQTYTIQSSELIPQSELDSTQIRAGVKPIYGETMKLNPYVSINLIEYSTPEDAEVHYSKFVEGIPSAVFEFKTISLGDEGIQTTDSSEQIVFRRDRFLISVNPPTVSDEIDSLELAMAVDSKLETIIKSTATIPQPGFEATFSIAGLLAVAYLVRRRK